MSKLNIGALLRTHLKELKPYSSAREEFSGKADIYLDANENPLGSATEKNYNRYPDPLQKAIKTKLGAIKGVDANQIFMGNGSDEAIDLLIRAFCDPGKDHIIITPPTYGMYKVCADINAVECKSIPLTSEFQLDKDKLIDGFSRNSKLIFLCSPNNPSGNLLNKEVIIEVVKNFKGLVIIDEAYIDFTPEESMLNYLKDFPNMVVLQTFSKAWGLAGIRAGMAFAHSEIIGILNKIKPPYNINTYTQERCLEALENQEVFEEMVKEILSQKEYLSGELQKLEFVKKVFPSDTNFLLVKFDHPLSIYDFLINKGIIVRDRTKVLHGEGCLRISIGSREENEGLILNLKEWASK